MKPSFNLFATFLLLATGAVAQTPCSWSPVGGGFPAGSSPGFVIYLEGFDDGSGLSLLAGGVFSTGPWAYDRLLGRSASSVSGKENS